MVDTRIMRECCCFRRECEIIIKAMMSQDETSVERGYPIPYHRLFVSSDYEDTLVKIVSQRA